MDEREATWIAEDWSGSRGLVPRGPRRLLGWSAADPAEVERLTGRRPSSDTYRVDVGGRFLRSGAVVYPGGVPYPDALVGRTATVSSEVWLYVDDTTSRIVGTHSWPEAIRRPVAAPPEADYPDDAVVHPDDAAGELDFELPVPSHPDWWPALVACSSRDDATVLMAADTVPDPVNELVLFSQGGISLRATRTECPDYAELLRTCSPPFRAVTMRGCAGAGREQGRVLGPQTWPWPGELLYWRDGLAIEIKGFVPLDRLEEVARTIG